MSDQGDDFSHNSLVENVKHPFPGRCYLRTPTGRQIPKEVSLGGGTQRLTTVHEECFKRDEVVPHDENIHVYNGNGCSNQTQHECFKADNDKLPNILESEAEIEPESKHVSPEKYQLLSLPALEHLTLENIKKIDGYLSAGENKLTQINTKYLLPQLKKEYRDLASLVLKAQNCVDDIIETLDHKSLSKKTEIIQNTSIVTSCSKICTLSDCRQSLVGCLKCLLQIKSFLKDMSKTCPEENLPNFSGMHGINTPSISTLASEKELFVSLSHSSASTPLPNCPCCGSTTSYQNSIISNPHLATNRSSSPSREKNCHLRISSKDEKCTFIYKDENPKFIRSSLTNTTGHVSNGKLRWAHNSHENVASENVPNLRNPIKHQGRPTFSEGSLGFKKCSNISKNFRETQSLHTPERLTCISIIEDTGANNNVPEGILHDLHKWRGKDLHDISLNNLERKGSYTTIDITIVSDDDKKFQMK